MLGEENYFESNADAGASKAYPQQAGTIRKSAAQPSLRARKPPAEEDEGMDPTKYYENRLDVLAAQKEAGKNQYPHKFHVSMSVPEYIEKYRSLDSREHLDDVEVSLAGHITKIRESSSKLIFYDLQGGGVKVQVFTDAREIEAKLRTDLIQDGFGTSVLR